MRFLQLEYVLIWDLAWIWKICGNSSYNASFKHKRRMLDYMIIIMHLFLINRKINLKMNKKIAL